MPVLLTPPGYQPPRLGVQLGRGSEGTVYENLDEPGWVVKVFDQGSNPLAARNQLENLAKGRAIPGRADNVVKAHPLLDAANPRSQNWLVEEQVLRTDAPEDLIEKNKVRRDFQNIPDADSNLRWGSTKDNATLRWMLIE